MLLYTASIEEKKALILRKGKGRIIIQAVSKATLRSVLVPHQTLQKDLLSTLT